MSASEALSSFVLRNDGPRRVPRRRATWRTEPPLVRRWTVSGRTVTGPNDTALRRDAPKED